MKNMKKTVLLSIKRIALILLVMLCSVHFVACSRVSVSCDGGGEATFKVYENDIETKLSEEDTKTLAEIFNGKDLYSFLSSVPSCGFSDDVAVRIGAKTFCFAMDGCSTIRVGASFFDVSAEENEVIKAILEKYGFHFPCV